MNFSERTEPLRNILLRVAYDGTDFYGWQIQPHRVTIQGTLADALEKITGVEVAVCGAGRTDAGVHALGQAANIKLSSPIPYPNLVKAVNQLLTESIRVLSAQQVPDDFHARYHALSKIYKYRIFRGAICPPWLCRYVFPYPYPLDEEAIQEAANFFQGTMDFRSFAATDGNTQSQADEKSQEQSIIQPDTLSEEKSYVRTIFSSTVTREGDVLIYTVRGNGFLRHMVRNIVGTLIDVGRGRTAPEEIPAMIAACKRSEAGPTAPARGLHLISVSYPSETVQPFPMDNREVPVKIE